MSQLSIMRSGSAGDTAGVNMPPPPDKPTGAQETASGEPAPAAAQKRPAITGDNRVVKKGAGKEHRVNPRVHEPVRSQGNATVDGSSPTFIVVGHAHRPCSACSRTETGRCRSSVD